MTVSAEAVALPLLPTPSGVVLPEMVVTIALTSAEARAAADAATDGRLLLVPRLDGRFAKVGTIGQIEDRGRLRDGTPALTVRGVGRAVLGAASSGAEGTAADALWVEAEPVEDEVPDDQRAEVHELAVQYRALAASLLEALGGGRITGVLPDADHPGELADTVGYWPELSTARRVELLETVVVRDRLELAVAWATEALEEIRLARARQRSDGDAIEAYRARLADLEGAGVSESVRDAVAREIDRLERAGDQSQEASWIRTWLDEVLALPFGTATDDNHDLVAARAVLDADHTGLDEVKDRIVEHLAVRKLRAERHVADDSDRDARRSGAILALVGPPGVGKTSLGESVARALGRSFVRLALGGIRDEAEIRGHRRTYVGARPGRVVRALAEAGTMNPVVLLDELDKVGADWRGDPSAALLEVLDPAQNHSFRDHYLEFELDLSDVVFIATANRLDTIPGPLLDRVEVIELDGYTEAEKVTIARDHILGRLTRRLGLRDDEVTITDAALEAVVADWTREAGVRNLERKLERLLRKAATRLATDPSVAPITIDVDDLREALGKPVPRDETADRITGPGIATGLAVTGSGGDVLFVEAAAMDGDSGLTLTGQLGDVMKESGEIARSYLRAHADELGVEGAERRLHVHFPAGAVPKDGPSAGITMTTAIASLLTGRPVRPEVAMTGEVTLGGKVLPIGGVKQKLLAAHRAGITEVVLPDRNGDDLADVPEEVLADLTVHLVRDVREVLEVALTPPAMSAS